MHAASKCTQDFAAGFAGLHLLPDESVRSGCSYTTSVVIAFLAEQTNTWARDDPAFIVLQLGMLAVRMLCRRCLLPWKALHFLAGSQHGIQFDLGFIIVCLAALLCLRRLLSVSSHCLFDGNRGATFCQHLFEGSNTPTYC